MCVSRTLNLDISSTFWGNPEGIWGNPGDIPHIELGDPWGLKVMQFNRYFPIIN